MEKKYFIATTPEAVTGETKNARLHLAVYPSVKEDLKALAAARQTSLMDLVNQILRGYVVQNAEEIEFYKSLQSGIKQILSGLK